MEEIRKSTSFTIDTNSIKYLGVTLTKQVEDLYDKNFKSLKKEIEEDTRKCKDLPCSWVGSKNGNLTKSNLEQANTQHQTKWRETPSDSTEVRNKARLPTQYLFNIVLQILARAIRQQKEIKGIQIRKKEVKRSLFADDIIVYISGPKNSTKELLQLMNTLSNVAGYKINSKKSVAVLYTDDKRAGKEIR